MLSHRFRPLFALAAASLTALLLGCGYSNPYPAGSYERALAFRTHDKPRLAAEAYAAFLRRSPTDSLAARAQLDKARCYLETKEYPLASVELQILRQEYPTSDNLEEAMFLEAKSHLMQVGRIERDVTPARDARVLFQSFLKTYPDSKYAAEAQADLVKISDMLVRKELRVADLYGRLHKPDAVAITLDRLITQETDSSLRDGVMLRRARVALRADDDARARDVLGQLLKEYPDSRYARDARKLLDGLADSAGS